MKLLFALSTLAMIFALTVSLPAKPLGLAKEIELLTNQLDSNADGTYKFSYTLSDGTKRTEEAVLKNVGTDEQTLEIRGTVTWVGPDDITYTINFVADENGFQPKGTHLPK